MRANSCIRVLSNKEEPWATWVIIAYLCTPQLVMTGSSSILVQACNIVRCALAIYVLEILLLIFGSSAPTFSKHVSICKCENIWTASGYIHRHFIDILDIWKQLILFCFNNAYVSLVVAERASSRIDNMLNKLTQVSTHARRYTIMITLVVLYTMESFSFHYIKYLWWTGF